jgi:hypothetical protein
MNLADQGLEIGERTEIAQTCGKKTVMPFPLNA